MLFQPPDPRLKLETDGRGGKAGKSNEMGMDGEDDRSMKGRGRKDKGDEDMGKGWEIQAPASNHTYATTTKMLCSLLN